MTVNTSVFGSSLLSPQRLMQAREFYCPAPAPGSAAAALDRWTRRVAIQTELGSARELAGLTDAELAVLHDEFVRCQSRPRFDRLRHAIPVGVVLAAMGALGVASHGGFTAGTTETAPQLLSAACLVVGLCVLGIGVLVAFGMLHLDVAYGTTGLLVGRLDEHHPWLYKAAGLLRYDAANAYREGVLRERGPLRGVDYVIMREMAQAHEALDQMQTARSVAQRIQQPAAPVDPGPVEPRVLLVASRGETAPKTNAG